MFELPIRLMARERMEAAAAKNPALARPVSDQKNDNKKGGKEEQKELNINEAIEEFLESDFEIKASNAAKKAE